VRAVSTAFRVATSHEPAWLCAAPSSTRSRAMSTWKRIALRLTLGAVAIVGLLLVATTSAFADGAGATHFSQDFDDVTQTFVPPDPMATNPCTGVPGTLMLTFSGFVHITINKAQDGWDTGNMHGDFSFVPSDQAQPSYAGHFASWFGDSFNRNNSVSHFTLNVHGTGTDGSTLALHEAGHFSTNADGTVTVVFDKATC
jgi:hypothetical protein